MPVFSGFVFLTSKILIFVLKLYTHQMSDTYKTIQKSTEGIYKEKGSKFLSFAIPVNDTDEIKEIVKEYRKRFFDARHVCYAYMIGAEREKFRTNDDGEPSGTAGRPILGQINSRELTNILVIVIRYFGGILLGTGGLVVAYKEATADALDKAEVIEKTVDVTVTVYFGYEIMNDAMRVVKETGANVVKQSFDNLCEMKLSIRKNDADLLVSKLKNIQGLTIEENNE
ncbi:MAG: putative Impact protein [Bacteroidetes bacterium]|nr:putative Impact protein [Bacteroidota bacterium]